MEAVSIRPRAVTNCVIATAAKRQIDDGNLARLAEMHHGEDQAK